MPSSESHQEVLLLLLMMLGETDTFVILSRTCIFLLTLIMYNPLLLTLRCWASSLKGKVLSWLSILFTYWIQKLFFFFKKDNRLNIRSHVLTFLFTSKYVKKTRFPVFLSSLVACCWPSSTLDQSKYHK